MSRPTKFTGMLFTGMLAGLNAPSIDRAEKLTPSDVQAISAAEAKRDRRRSKLINLQLKQALASVKERT